MTTALDVVEQFPATVRAAMIRRAEKRQQGPPQGLNGDETILWQALDPADPKGLEHLTRKTGLGVSAMAAALLGLEMRGLARSLPGPRYVRGGWTGGGRSIY